MWRRRGRRASAPRYIQTLPGEGLQFTVAE